MKKIKYIMIAAIIMMISLTTAALAMDRSPEAVPVSSEENAEVEAALRAEATFSQKVVPSAGQAEPAIFPGEVIYFSDFEGDNGGMTPSIDWVWDVYAWSGTTCDPYTNYPPPNAYSGTHMWGTRLNTCYQNLGNNAGFDTCTNTNPTDDSILSITVDLTGYTDVSLSWWEWYDLFSAWDWAQVSANGVAIYNHCETSFDPPTEWVQQIVDLTPYAGGPVTLEFHMMASSVVNHTGWFIDDVMVTGVATGPDIVVDPLLLELTLASGMTDTLPFTITNQGSADLTWTLGGGASWMSQDPTSGTVLSGESTVVAVTFDATGLAPAVYTTTLDVESNDPDEPIVTIDASMTVYGEPDIVVEPLSLEMTLTPDQTGTMVFTISNNGLAGLTWELSDGAPWMSQDPTSGTIPAGAMTAVYVTFDSTGLALGVYTAIIEVISDDPDEPSIEISVSLTVTNYGILLPIVIR